MKTCAFENGTECEALREKNCLRCPFYKTEKEAEESREKARKRLQNLPKATQILIHRKYYT